MTRIDVAMADHMQHKFHTKGELRCTSDGHAEAYRSPIGAGGFAISRFATYRRQDGGVGYDKFPYETAIYISTEALVHELRQMQHRRITAKHHNQLLSPSLYDPAADSERDRGLPNVYAARGLWFDFEDGELGIDELAAIWHDLELIIYPSYRSTPEKPRFRVGIPTISYMTAEAYNRIIDQLIARLNAHGYRSQKELEVGVQGKHHGVDMSKRHAAALFFLPTLTADQAGIFFHHHTGGSRKPLDPRVWLEAAEIVLPEPMPEGHQRPTQIAPDKLEAVLAEWRMAPRGFGNRAFHRMAWRLLSYGMDVPTIEGTLCSEAQWASASSRDDRRRQIPYILSDLMRRGQIYVRD